MGEFVEEIVNKKRTNFSVTNIPIGDLKEFKKLCSEEYGNVYFVGIIQLMKTKKFYEQVVPYLSSLQNQIDDLKSKLKNGGILCQN